jgi:hypothetical protein
VPEWCQRTAISRRSLLKAVAAGALGVAASTLLPRLEGVQTEAFALMDINRSCMLTLDTLDANPSMGVAGASVYLDLTPLGSTDAQGTLVRRVPPGLHQLTATKDGYKTFTGQINVPRSDTFAFALPLQSSSSPARFPVGVNYIGMTDQTDCRARDLPLFKAANIRHVRLGRPLPETYAKYGGMVDLLTSNGIEVLGILQDENLVSDVDAWGDYVYNTVLQFKGKIRCWSVWNEPNWDNFRGNATGYTEFLKKAYVRAKQADPQSFILSGDLLNVTDSVSYLTKMYDNGAQGFMDAIAIHPYCYPASPLEPNRGLDGQSFWELPLVRDLMVKRGDASKKVWVTEFGYTTPGGSFQVGDGQTVTEQDQATYLTETLQLGSTWDWLERVYVYEWMDSGQDWGQYGLVRQRYNPPYETKPSLDSVRNFNLNGH